MPGTSSGGVGLSDGSQPRPLPPGPPRLSTLGPLWVIQGSLLWPLLDRLPQLCFVTGSL